MRPGRLAVAVAAATLWPAAVAVAAVPPAAVPPQATHANVQDEPVRYDRPTDSTSTRGGAVAPVASGGMADLWHVTVALSVVLGLIFGLRWVARKARLVPDAGRPGKGVRVLSRTVLSPKQQIMLIQVGRRVVVVGDSGAAGMRPLCEIDDPDEVATLIGEAKAPPAAATTSFGGLFRRASASFDVAGNPPERPAGKAEAPEVPGEVAGLLDKVRRMQRQFDS